jgi:hypothetical protein
MASFRNVRYATSGPKEFVDPSALEKLQGSTLFYPCSGNDLLTPIRLFAPYVQNFWFVDRAYFIRGHQDTRDYGFDRDAWRHTPLLVKNSEYRLLEVHIDDESYQSQYDPDIKPCVRTEVYEHLPSGNLVTLRKRRGYGFSAFRKEIRSLGVFFYRGDSQGEGGSGNHWLSKEHIREVLAKLQNHGLLVLDGSDGTPYRRRDSTEYGPFWKYQSRIFTSGQEVKDTCKPFTDTLGNAYTCVGYAGIRYGNTLAWQCTHHEGSSGI